MACDNFQLDMSAAFGMCKCGQPKADHTPAGQQVKVALKKPNPALPPRSDPVPSPSLPPGAVKVASKIPKPAPPPQPAADPVPPPGASPSPPPVAPPVPVAIAYVVQSDFAGNPAAGQPALRGGERVEVARDAQRANGWVWGQKADGAAGWLPETFLLAVPPPGQPAVDPGAPPPTDPAGPTEAEQHAFCTLAASRQWESLKAEVPRDAGPYIGHSDMGHNHVGSARP